ncbi:uncharacterized protein [Nicotiana sylvestris]|uniref:uncharacterized protein n=1 Tax=Nicotiana sylvestris TaxID=4096 RepID=UPI00388C94C0
MLRACAIEFEVSWDQFLPLAEFAYNNNYQSSIQMEPYEALYGRRYRSPVGWFELSEDRLLGTDLVQDALEKVKLGKSSSGVSCFDASEVSRGSVVRVGFKFNPVGQGFILCGGASGNIGQVRKLRSKNIASIKVQLRGQPFEEATWETKHDMYSRYAHLFTTSGKLHLPIETYKSHVSSVPEKQYYQPSVN